uniref:Kazal-like domain-containing protein n=1 Tax=Canis lupus familiaris TaxID=9615 RepID=A0A8C0QDB3_CANLF
SKYISTWLYTYMQLLIYMNSEKCDNLKLSDYLVPNCDVYIHQLHFCTREMDPICATNGQTYSNTCVFCSEQFESGGAFKFGYYGRC